MSARALEVLIDSSGSEMLQRLRSALDGSGPALLPRSDAIDAELPTEVESNVALVIETSGSTGVPKRVALSAEALLASAAASATALGGQGQWLLALPTHYVAGAQVLIRSIAAGTEPVVLSPGHFDAAVFRDVAATMTREKRFVSLVPVQLARLLDAASGDAELLAILCRFDGILVGGQALPAELRERAEQQGLRIARTYGSSETSGGCVYNGLPLDRVLARSVDGLLELGGPTLAECYLGDPARTASAFHEENGVRWYRTGDLGTVDEDGRVTVLGRADNVIISGGEKVLLDAVERRVRELNGFTGAVVVAADSEEWGQVPVVVLAESSPVPLAALRAHVAETLGRAAAPARIVSVEHIPHLASGKPDRRTLTTLVARR